MSQENTVYFITGANKGLGLGMVQTLLLRTNTTVIATSRSHSDDLSSLAQATSASSNASGNALILCTLEATATPSEYHTLVQDLINNRKISHIDVAIANAGSSPAFNPIAITSFEDMTNAFETNTLGPLKLFQSLQPLLSASKTTGKFILVSSILGSIGGMDKEPSGAYGVSKAAANYLIRKVHIEVEDVVTLVLHPGWVRTDMGRGFAKALKEQVGYDGPIPLTVQESVDGMLAQIDKATKATTSGNFIDYKGDELPW